MKIAMVGQKTNVTRFGGIERHVGLLADRLAERGHEVTVFTRSRYGEPVRPFRGVSLVRRPCVPSKHLEAITHSTLCSLESGLRGYDVVHFHGVGPSLAIPFAKLTGHAAVIATVHDQDYNKDKWSPFARRMLRAGEASACRRSDRVITVARYIRQHLQLAYGCTAEYIPNGNDPLHVQPPGPALAEHGLEAGNYLLFLARLVPEKGCDVLIRAVRESSTPYRLAVVGGASYSDEHAEQLRRLAGDDPRIAFLGFQSGDALDELRTNAGAYVMPSRQEGLPLALLEMLWYGMPVIASDIPAVHEVDGAVPDDRLTRVPPGDVEALRRAIEALPWPGAVAAHGELNWPTWAEVAEQVEGVYERTLARRGRRRAA
ncbi:MAG TPA: glycosyltransferase family 4 protein [Gaiellales bacterium]|nr:glycosyltransferase family 4 protein [Gaiellales bacterium]